MVKRPFLVPGVIGLAVITLSLINMMLFPQTALGQIEGIRSPIIAFEFAETKEEINTLFGVNGAPEQADFIRKMDQGNRLDYLYMLLYSGFLFSFALLAGKQTGQKWVYAGAVLAALALVGDALENVQLLTITANLQSGDFVEALARLHWFTWLKWGSLALYFLLMAGWFWGKRPLRQTHRHHRRPHLPTGPHLLQPTRPHHRTVHSGRRPHVPTHDHLLLHYQDRNQYASRIA